MPELATDAAIRKVRGLPFCYLCGNGFAGKTEKTRDHVPPKSIFAAEDRGTPLILPTHQKCNGAQSNNDEIIGQLIGTIHGKYPSSKRSKLDVRMVESEAAHPPSLGLVGTNLHNVIRRWLRGFHSALYGEYLPNETKNFLHTPFPSGAIDKDNQVQMDEMLIQHPLFVEIVKRNRMAHSLDRIVCYNGKCSFECVWETSDDGQAICIFALKLYEWSKLADTESFPRRGCVGMYMPVSGRPPNATTATSLDFPISNIDALDAFGE